MKERILAAYRRAFAELDLGRAVEHALERALERAVERAPRRPHRVVAIGKAAKAMFAGTRGLDIEDAVVIGPEDAGHPLPDARSVRAARRCLELVTREGEARILVLVSGGASALVCAPAPGITLADKRGVTRMMLRSGATIQEINTVRKHLSIIKGGGLARAASPRDVLTLIASDVIGGEASDVGSGPSVLDASTVSEARALLRRHAPAYASLPLVTTLARDRRPLRARILVSPERLARSMAHQLGEGVRVLWPSQADVIELADEYAKHATRMRPGEALVRAAEPSVVLPSTARAGKGGRCTHLAALVARVLPRSVTFAAIATDGVDGASETAGAIVESLPGSLSERSKSLSSRELDAAIDRFDTGAFLLRHGKALPSKPTGHNLADLHVLVRRR